MTLSLRFVRCLTAATCLLGGISVNAAPAESGYYFGINYGQSTFDTSYQSTGALTTTSSWSIDDADMTWSAAMGYRVNQYFGIELAYVDLGQLTFVETGRNGGPPTITIAGEGKSSGALVDFIGSLPLGNFEFSARGGAFFAKTKLSTQVGVTTVNNGAATGTASTIRAMGGVGAGYTFADHFHVRIDYSYYPKVGDEDKTGQADVSTITGGFQYRF